MCWERILKSFAIVPETDIAALLNPDSYIGTSVRQVDRVIEKLLPLCF